MQTREFVQALDQIIGMLQLRDLVGVLGSFAIGPNQALSAELKSQFADLLFALDSGFTAIKADPMLDTVATSLDLSVQVNRKGRADLMTMFQNASSSQEVIGNRIFFQLFASARSIVQLSDALHKVVIKPQDVISSPRNDDIILEITDYDGAGIPVQRLADVFDTLVVLYEAIVRYRAVETVVPVIRWADSGSNITISFQGLGEIIREMRLLFTDGWRRLRFPKNERIERDIETALKQVTLVKELDEIVRSGGEARESAEIARHLIMLSMVKLLGDGVLQRDLESESAYDRGEVLAAIRDVKQLGTGSPSAPLTEPLNRPT